MDFFNREVRDSFDKMFDLNHDNKLDAGEQAYQFEFLEEQTKTDFIDGDDLDLDIDDIDF